MSIECQQTNTIDKMVSLFLVCIKSNSIATDLCFFFS